MNAWLYDLLIRLTDCTKAHTVSWTWMSAPQIRAKMVGGVLTAPVGTTACVPVASRARTVWATLTNVLQTPVFMAGTWALRHIHIFRSELLCHWPSQDHHKWRHLKTSSFEFSTAVCHSIELCKHNQWISMSQIQIVPNIIDMVLSWFLKAMHSDVVFIVI